MVALFAEIAWTVILPIFLIIGLGAGVGRVLKLDPDALNKLNLYVFVPALAFTKFLHSALDLGQIALVGLYWLLLVGCLWGAGTLTARWMGVARKKRPMVAMASMFPNSGNYGIPVAELAFGSWGVAVQAVVLAAQNLLFFTVGAFIAGGGTANLARGIRMAARIPVIYAILAAFALRAKPELLPGPLDEAVRILGQGLVPIALLTLGAQLGAGRPPRPVKEIRAVLVAKLLLAPVAGWLLVTLMGLEARLAAVLVVSASHPTAVNTALLAIEFRRQPGLASAAVMWTTLASAATVTAVIALVGG